jgi:hypothetical protein
MGTAREAAGRILLAELELDEPGVDALLDLAGEVLGAERTQRCVELAAKARLSRRVYELAQVAALVRGTQIIGPDWWTRPHPVPFDRRDTEWEPVSPDEWLARDSSADDGPDWRTTLWELGGWIADDVAEANWGPFVDELDANSSQPLDRFPAPAGAVSGEWVNVRFEPGGSVEAVIEPRSDGTLGTRLIGDNLHSAPAEVWWAWSAHSGRYASCRLPNEDPDAYAQPVEQPLAGRLWQLGAQVGFPSDLLGPGWVTLADVCTAAERLDFSRRSMDGPQHDWHSHVDAFIDGVPVRHVGLCRLGLDD